MLSKHHPLRPGARAGAAPPPEASAGSRKGWTEPPLKPPDADWGWPWVLQRHVSPQEKHKAQGAGWGWVPTPALRPPDRGGAAPGPRPAPQRPRANTGPAPGQEGRPGWGLRVLGSLGDSCRLGWPACAVRVAVTQGLASRRGSKGWPGGCHGASANHGPPGQPVTGSRWGGGVAKAPAVGSGSTEPCLQPPSLVSCPPARPGQNYLANIPGLPDS